MTHALEKLIEIRIINNQTFITNLNDWEKIRKNYRIVGLSTNNETSIPLMLEEAELLVNRNLAVYSPKNSKLNFDKKLIEIFINLWSMELFLTSGQKFGADYLVYKQDPDFSHSDFIIHCYDSHVSIPVLSLVAKARLANTVKKTAVLAFYSPSEIQYIKLSWLPFNQR